MPEIFGKIFWGFVIVFIEIHLFVLDILPDPLGYLLIFQGIKSLSLDTPTSKKAQNLALSLVFISVPSIFIQENKHSPSLDGWTIYTISFGLLKLALVFYLFKCMYGIARNRRDVLLRRSTLNTFRFYMGVMLICYLIQSFLMNLNKNLQSILSIITITGFLIMEIVFLLLLRRYMKLDHLK